MTHAGMGPEEESKNPSPGPKLTPPKAVMVRPAASAMPHIFCSVANPPSYRHPNKPPRVITKQQPNAPGRHQPHQPHVSIKAPPSESEVHTHSGSCREPSTSNQEQSSADAQSDGGRAEAIAACQHSRGHSQQGLQDGVTDTKQIAPYNVITSGEYVSTIKRAPSPMVGSDRQLAAPSEPCVSYGSIKGSDSSQEMLQGHSQQHAASAGDWRDPGKLQDDAVFEPYSNGCSGADPLRQTTCSQPESNRGCAFDTPHNQQALWASDLSTGAQQAQHAAVEHDYVTFSPRHPASSHWARSSSISEHSVLDCASELLAAPSQHKVMLPAWERKAWQHSRQLQHHHQRQHQQQQQQQQQQTIMSLYALQSSGPGQSEWQLMSGNPCDLDAFVGGDSADFAVEASMWMLQNDDPADATINAAAGEMSLCARMHCFWMKTYVISQLLLMQLLAFQALLCKTLERLAELSHMSV